MRFQAVHKLVSYLLAAAAVGMVMTSGVVPLPTAVLIVVVAVLSWFVEPGTRMGVLLDRAGLVFNVGALAFFAISLFAVVRSFPEPDLTPVLNLVLFLLGYKLFHRRNNRDYLQIYILSFLLILASAWLAQSVLFIVGFGACVILSTWTLILFHLRREIEDNYLVKHRRDAASEKITAARVLNSRRVVSGPFFAVTGLVAVAVLVGAALVFAVIPRIGLGFLSGGARRRMSLVGFSDEVTLGHHGVLSQDNETVVLRAKVTRIAEITDSDARDRAIAGLYWRGTVYDTYQNGQWVRRRVKHDKTRLGQPEIDFDGSRLFYVDSAQAPAPLDRRHRVPLSETDEQEIQVVALTFPVAFALDQPVAFRMAPTQIGSWLQVIPEAHFSGEVGLKVQRALPSGRVLARVTEFSGARYFAYSRNARSGRPDVNAGKPMSQIGRDELDNYLGVPVSLTPRVGELVRSLTKDKPPIVRVQAITTWLKDTHHYTIDLRRDERVADPLEDFLFNQDAGHCEYFASAAAIMLRLGGVPTRYVNGFLGGEWNDLSGHITIRDSRAHSWIEAYLGNLGWVRVDATPSGGVSSRMGRLRQLFDSIELLWGQWVIDYDTSRQLQIARKLSNRMGFSTKPSGGIRWSRPDPNLLVGVSSVLVAAVALWWVLRRRRTRPGMKRATARRDGPPIVRLYQRTLARLAARGWTRAPAETPREFARRVGWTAPDGAEVLHRLTEHYNASRYGERDIEPAMVETLKREIARVEPAPPPEMVVPAREAAPQGPAAAM